MAKDKAVGRAGKAATTAATNWDAPTNDQHLQQQVEYDTNAVIELAHAYKAAYELKGVRRGIGTVIMGDTDTVLKIFKYADINSPDFPRGLVVGTPDKLHVAMKQGAISGAQLAIAQKAYYDYYNLFKQKVDGRTAISTQDAGDDVQTSALLKALLNEGINSNGVPSAEFDRQFEILKSSQTDQERLKTSLQRVVKADASLQPLVDKFIAIVNGGGVK